MLMIEFLQNRLVSVNEEKNSTTKSSGCAVPVFCCIYFTERFGVVFNKLNEITNLYCLLTTRQGTLF